ncbi:hypothetical protein [Desulfovibrio sp. JC010]|uniref:hypothetical protein n=1 Tax=Desulfovibrio sp. JC010 TaxID=2593641 RepID=UPI0013D365EE|nr:hypothetical protein [Desulfovibrio sp. JC010]NDV26328.1 hypothetical protein [Desulfovibrio sp. JC010]
MFNKIINSIFLLPIFVFVYPTAFLYSQNVNMLSVPDFLVNLGYMLYACLIVILLMALGAVVCKKLFRSKPVWYNCFSGLATFGLVLLMTAFCYVSLRPYFSTAVMLALSGAGLACFCAIMVFKFGCRWLNTFVGALCLLAFLQIGVSLMGRDTEGINVGQRDRIEFTKKTDVYVILAESYNAFDVQEKYYGLKDTRLKKFLLDDGFKVESIYSSYDHTYASTLSMFLMQHHYNNRSAGHKDLTYGVRGLVNGGRSNPALNVFKDNGYFIALMDNGIFTNKGELVDYMPENNGALPTLVAEVLTVPRSIRYISGFFEAIYKPFLSDDTSASTAEYLERAFRSNVDHKPGMYFTRDGAGHTKDSKHVKEKDWIKTYRSLIAIGDNNIINYIKTIEAHNPDAIIVVIGDHGSYRTTTTEKRNPNPGPQELVDDIFRVLFAIRLPKDTSFPENWDTVATNHVNLFPKIFTLLSGDESILGRAEAKTHSVAISGKVKAIDGVPTQD